MRLIAAPTGPHIAAGATRGKPRRQLLESCTFAGGHSFSTRRLRYGIERVPGKS